MYTYALSLKYSDNTRLVANAKGVIIFATRQMAEKFIRDNFLEFKVNIHTMSDKNDWYDYRSIQVDTLKKSVYNKAHSSWVVEECA